MSENATEYPFRITVPVLASLEQILTASFTRIVY